MSGPTGASRGIPVEVDPAELLRRVRLLELAARRNAGGRLGGDWVTSIPGQGLLFHETRKYVAGEPARRIDWAISTRVGEPHVRVDLEERQREVYLAIDLSPSMHTGLGEKTKLELTVELAATLAVSAIHSGDRLGWVFFADRVLAEERGAPGGRQLFRFLRSLLESTGAWTRPVAESDPRAAIHALERRRGRFVIFLISDFIDHDLPVDLAYVRARQDLSLLHVYDPLEYEPSSRLVLSAVSPEGPPAPSPLTPGALGTLEEMRAFLRREAGRHRIACASFSTHEAVAPALDRFFHLKRRWRTR